MHEVKTLVFCQAAGLSDAQYLHALLDIPRSLRVQEQQAKGGQDTRPKIKTRKQYCRKFYN